MLRSLLVGVLLLVPAAAHADVPPPDLCNDVGSPCTAEGALGICEEATCSRIDYSSWSPGDDSPPAMTEYPCNRCAPGPEGAVGVGGAVVGVVCCVLALGVLVGVAGFLIFRRKKNG